MENTATQDVSTRQTRPTLLTVLCILSLLGALFSILSTLLKNWFTNQFLPNSAAVQFQLKVIFGTELFFTVLGLSGVVLMWKLRRTGFYLYCIASLAIVALGYLAKNLIPSLDMTGNASFELPGLGTFETSLFLPIVTVLFIILYGLNLKAMHSVSLKSAVGLFLMAVLIFGSMTYAVVESNRLSQITGRIILQGPITKTVLFGYQARIKKQVTSNEVALGNRQIAHKRKVLSHDKIQAELIWDKKTLKYQLTSVPVGEYFVYVRYGEKYVDWSVIEVKDNKAMMETPLTIDLARTGSFLVDLTNGTGQYVVKIYPLTSEKDYFDSDRPYSLEDLGDFKAEQVMISGINEGLYRLKVYDVYTDSAVVELTEVGSWDLSVKTGQTSELRINSELFQAAPAKRIFDQK